MAIADPLLRGKDQRRLRTLLVYPEFQIPLIAINMLLTALGFVVVWASGNEVFSSLHPTAALSGMEIDVFRKVLAHHYWNFNVRVIAFALGAMFLSGAATLYLSHKIAGPMVTLRRHFEGIKNGVDPIPRMHFRDRDFLMDIPPLVNEAISKLEYRSSSKKKSA